jgi:YD repeat-containing protein
LVNSLGNRMSYTYNANGIVQSVQNPAGAIVTYVSDQVNRLTNFIDPLGNINTYQYDANSRLVSVTNPLGAVWSMSYDLNGRLISATDPLGNITSYGYSENQSAFGELAGPKGNDSPPYWGMGQVCQPAAERRPVQRVSRSWRSLVFVRLL